MSFLLTLSCEEDGTNPGGGGGTTGAPFVDLLVEAGFVDFDAVIAPGESFSVKLDAIPDASELNSLEIFEENIQLDPARITIVDIPTVNNPQVVTGDAKLGFTWEITIVGETTPGFYRYDFDVTAENLEVGNVSVTIEVQDAAAGLPPELELIGDATRTSDAGNWVSFSVNTIAGGSTLTEIKVSEDGFTMSDLSRLAYNDITRNFDTNPQLLDAEHQENGFFDLLIKAQGGSHSYTIELIAEDGQIATLMTTINEAVTTTPLDATFEGRLVSNADGPNNGGLDLDDGTAVASSSAMAEIADNGIDISQPASSNWIQTISPVNGAELRTVDLSSIVEIGTFGAVDSKEQILTAFNNGSPVSESPVVLIGDVFVVSSAGSLYIMEVSDVVATSDNNEDYYIFNIKR